MTEKEIIHSLVIHNDLQLKADWSLLLMVLSYLIDNAVKFSPLKGKITVEATEKGNECVICISDQGGGIESEWIDKIFDEFAIKNLMSHQKGQGLSLAISQNILAYHGGGIEVESTPKNGSTFIIKIPVPNS